MKYISQVNAIHKYDGKEISVTRGQDLTAEMPAKTLKALVQANLVAEVKDDAKAVTDTASKD